MLTQITAIAEAFASEDLSAAQREALTLLCTAALEDWTARLLPCFSPEDCRTALVPAAAWTALASFLTARAAGEELVAFSAGDIALRSREAGKRELIGALQSSAERLLRPYVQDGSFVIRGVRG